MSSQDEETRELIARMNREFGQRPQPGDTPPPSEGQVYNLGTPPPQPMRLSLPLNRPRAVYVLLAINVVMYGLTQLVALRLQGTPNPFSLALLALGAKWGPAIQAGEYWRFLTPIVLHGNLLHLAFNSYALFSLGPEAERIFGTRRFLVIYLIAGFAGTLASFILSPGLSIGASGAIFGLIGALAAFFYRAKSLIGAEASRQQVTQLITMAGINLFLGLTVPTIDNAAHIGGLIAGGAAGYVLSPSYAIDDRLYPPVVVRTDRAASTWLTVGGIVVVLVVLAAWAVGRR
jgi:rhomboid protease GluP